MTNPVALRVLRAETEADLRALAEIDEELRPILARMRSEDVTRLEIMGAGYLVHNAYNACESILRRIAVAFENELTSERWHDGLLRRMTLEIGGVRPAVLSQDLKDHLDELRRFRRFFRHSYAKTLRAQNLVALGDHYGIAIPAFREAVERFLDIADDMITRSS